MELEAERTTKGRTGIDRERRNIAILLVAALIIVGGFYAYHLPNAPNNKSARQSPPRPAFIINSQLQIHDYVTEYSTKPNSLPNGIATDSHGNVWFSMGADAAIAELNPLNGTIHEYQLPEGRNTTVIIWGITVDNTKGIVWFTEEVSNAVMSFDTASHVFTRYPLPNPRSSPYQIALDQKGNAWFTEIDHNRIGELTTLGELREYEVPSKLHPLAGGNNLFTDNTGPAGIVVGANGVVWFTEAYANAVGSFSSGQFHQYNLSAWVRSPTGIAIDSGGNLWITQHGGSFISEFNPSSNYFRTFSTSTIGVITSLPYFVQVDSHDNVWFNEHYGNAIARFNPLTDRLVEYKIPSRVSPANISGAVTFTLAPDDQPWFAELYSGKIGTIDVSKSLNYEISIDGMMGSGKMLNVRAGNSVSVKVSIDTNDSSLSVALWSSVGSAARSGLALLFTPSAGRGNFTSDLAITNVVSRESNHLLYSVTISAETPDIVLSQVIKLET